MQAIPAVYPAEVGGGCTQVRPAEPCAGVPPFYDE